MEARLVVTRVEVRLVVDSSGGETCSGLEWKARLVVDSSGRRDL